MPKKDKGEIAISTNTKDASDAVREAISNLEARVDSIATALMGTEEFARTANVASNMQLRVKKGMNDHMARQLAIFNMPSRDDITAIGERLMVMDERLIAIEARLRALAPEAGKPASKSPPRTKRPAAKKKSAKAKKS